VVCLVEWAVWVEWVEWECNTIPVQNTLRTRVKQIINPQKEISGGFFYFLNEKISTGTLMLLKFSKISSEFK
jgi:hypothetical protein